MKKFIIFALILTVFTAVAFYTPTVNAAGKYTKIKTTTLYKYKKQLKHYKEETKKYKSITNWLYGTLANKFGYKYNKKTKIWTPTGYEAIECLKCHNHFAHNPKGTAKYKYCPVCGSDDLDY